MTDLRMTDLETPTLYGAHFSPFVRAVRIYCDELGLTHVHTQAPLGEPIAFRSPAHQALNPFLKIPVLLHRDLVLFESPAICRYLAGLPGAQPPEQVLMHAEKALVDQWALVASQYANQNLMDGLLLELAFPKGEDGQVRMDQVQENLPAARAFLAIIEAQLNQHSWLAGQHYSMADALITPFLHYAAQAPVLDAEGKLIKQGTALADYLERLRVRPSAVYLNHPDTQSR
ncbi:glutathione S-transferase family protein [Candidatus Thalassolituus haligoni]|uniref:glutathione S-transferase family protein n=1 Tax=Candidatus Thalassolituus haligoni TaxID=3100113 RepID=UPI0035128076